MESKIKALAILLISIATFSLGFLMATMNMNTFQIIPAATSNITLIIITFGFGMLFFGYFPWIITYFIGEYLGLAFKLQQQTILQISLITLSIILITFSSSWLGTSLYNDLTGKQSRFSKELKKNIIIITISLILAIISQFVI